MVRRQQYRRVPGVGRDASADLAVALRDWQRQAHRRSGKRGRDRGRMLHRHRRQLAPWLFAAGLVGLVVGANTVIPWFLGKPGAVAAVSVVGVVAVAVTGVVVWRRLPAHWRMRVGVLVPLLAAWIPWAAEALDWVRFAVILPVFLILKARHDREHRHADPTSKPNAEMAVPSTTEECWDEYVCAPGKAFPGARISNRRVETNEHAATEVFDGWLVRGEQTVLSAQAALPLIAGGLGGEVEDYLLDKHPTAKDSSRFIFKVIERGPATKPVFYSGPKCEDGKVLMGPFTDGVGYAPATLYEPKRMKNGMTIGETGIGKDRLQEVIALGGRHMGNTVIIDFDGQDGMSSPTLAREAWAFVPLDAAEAGRTALEAIHRHRLRKLIEQGGTSGFDPSPRFPGIMVVKHEVHSIYTRANAKAWANLAREANKVGMAQWDSDQDGSLDTFWLSVLRASLQSGTTIGMRTTDREQGTVLNDNSFNLADLPAVKGFGHLLNTGVKVRQAPFRGEWLPDQDDRDKGRVPAEVETVDEWFRKVPGVPLEDDSAQIWFSVMSGAGTPEPMTVDAASVPADVLEFPTPLTIVPAEPSSRDRVLAAIEAGSETHAEIVEATQLSDRTVRAKRAELAGEGLVVDAHGRTTLVEPVSVEAQTGACVIRGSVI